MRRWLPYPALSGLMLAIWLLLNQSLAPGHVLLGAVFGTGLALVLRRLAPPRLSIKNHRLLAVLAGRVVRDVIRSNFAVLKIILGGSSREVTSGFVSIPLQLTDRYALAILACIITSTPGTIWMSYESKERVLLIHVFDLVDENVWIRTITERYERPLREIFE